VVRKEGTRARSPFFGPSPVSETINSPRELSAAASPSPIRFWDYEWTSVESLYSRRSGHSLGTHSAGRPLLELTVRVAFRSR
jgi:hypothetical protein